MIDVTNSKKDWHDFWYSSEHMYPNETKHEYNELVDHLVSNMKKDLPDWTNNERPPFVPKKVTQSKSNYEAPFDTKAYANYKALVDKEKEEIDPHNLTEHIYKLGFRIDTLLSKIISQLDTVLEDDSVGENDKKGD